MKYSNHHTKYIRKQVGLRTYQHLLYRSIHLNSEYCSHCQVYTRLVSRCWMWFPLCMQSHATSSRSSLHIRVLLNAGNPDCLQCKHYHYTLHPFTCPTIRSRWLPECSEGTVSYLFFSHQKLSLGNAENCLWWEMIHCVCKQAWVLLVPEGCSKCGVNVTTGMRRTTSRFMTDRTYDSGPIL
jgi:hypothetical protein